MKKAVLSLLVIIFASSAFAGGFCVVSSEKEDKQLVEDFLEQLAPALPKNVATMAPHLCYYLNYADVDVTSTFMTYSADFDLDYQFPMKALAQDPKTFKSEGGIKINITKKFVDFLRFARTKRGEKEKTIQPEVLKYAGSFIVRAVFIASRFNEKPVRDIRKNITDKTTESSISDIITQHEMLVGYFLQGVGEQQSFLADDEDTKQWMFDAAVPSEFLEEGIIHFTEEGKFVKTNEMFFKGQYRVVNIARDMKIYASAVRELKKLELESGIPAAEAKKGFVGS